MDTGSVKPGSEHDDLDLGDPQKDPERDFQHKCVYKCVLYIYTVYVYLSMDRYIYKSVKLISVLIIQ